jgi:hypothetical protein
VTRDPSLGTPGAVIMGALDALPSMATVSAPMSGVRHPRPIAGVLRCALAMGCAGLVFALTVFAASPSAHDLLHDDSHQHTAGDNGCAVLMFASGVSLPVAPLALTPPILLVRGISPATAAEVFLVAPRYLRQPERGPPSSWVS